MASFLDALTSRCDVEEREGGRDWRRGGDLDSEPRMDGWFELGDKGFDALWEKEGAGESPLPSAGRGKKPGAQGQSGAKWHSKAECHVPGCDGDGHALLLLKRCWTTGTDC